MKEIPFTFKDLREIINVANYRLEVTNKRFRQLGDDSFWSIHDTLWEDGEAKPDPNYEAAEFGEAILRPREPGKFRVQEIRIIFSRIAEPAELQSA